MENNTLEKVTFDYYEKSPSYVKMINDMLPESKASNEKKLIIKELYNYYLNNSSEEKINEIVEISRLFREKIAITDVKLIALQVDYMYANFLDRFVFDTFNRGLIFDIMNDCVKLFVGYYDKVNTNIINESSIIMNSTYGSKRR